MSGQVEGIEWKVSDDRLSVFCRAQQQRDLAEVESQLQTEMSGDGITAELDSQALAGVLDSPGEEWATIAEGQSPTPPTPGYLEFYVDAAHLDRKAKVNEDGGVDYKDLKLFLNVPKGQELVRLHDPVPGDPGIDVYGEPVPPPEPIPLKLPVGEGVKVIEDGHLAIANEEGAIATSNRRISITKLFSVIGDVSYETGNIDFNGTINVGRNVLSGFELRARGDIIVASLVEAASMGAAGSILIMGGIQGGGKGNLKSGGSIRAKFATDATLSADCEILIQNNIINCDVESNEQVTVSSSQGVISGGSTRAAERIEVATLGSDLEVKTQVQIGIHLDLPKKISDLEDKINEIEEKSADVQKLVTKLAELKKAIGSLDGHQEATRVKLVRQQFLIKGNLGNMTTELETLQAGLERMRKGEVVVHDRVHAGVTIRFGSAVYKVTHAIRHTAFYYESGEIHTRPL